MPFLLMESFFLFFYILLLYADILFIRRLGRILYEEKININPAGCAAVFDSDIVTVSDGYGICGSKDQGIQNKGYSCKGRSNYDQGQKRRDKEDQSQGIRSKNCFGKGDQKEDPDYREKAGKDKGYVDGISYEEMCGKRSGCTGRRGRG